MVFKRREEEQEQGPQPPEEAPKEKAVTRPWEKSHSKWRRDYMKVGVKRPGWKTRWVRRDQVERRTFEGFQLAKPENYGVTPEIVGDGKSLINRIERRELVLMEIREELVQERQAYLREQNDMTRERNRRDVYEAAKKANREAGGEKHVTVEDEGSDRA